MALEIFAQIDKLGNTGMKGCNDYLIIGSVSEYEKLAEWVMDGYRAGNHKPTIKALAERIGKRALTEPYLRLKATECQTLLDALARKVNSPGKTAAATRLYKRLEDSLFVY